MRGPFGDKMVAYTDRCLPSNQACTIKDNLQLCVEAAFSTQVPSIISPGGL